MIPPAPEVAIYSAAPEVVIYSATPGGIACALASARAGVKVLLVNRTGHVGGFVTSGCGGWEAPYDGPRSAIFTEMLDAISSYYEKAYGKDSPQYMASKPSQEDRTRLGRPKVEPRVAEIVFDKMLAAEPLIEQWKGYIPQAARVRDGVVEEVVFAAWEGNGERTVDAKIFVDASYEGDLIAVCGAEYRLGRESRAEYGEPHAGWIFTRPIPADGDHRFPRDAVNGRLNIRYLGHSAGEIVDHPKSGQGDRHVMAYNFRPILTDDPENRVIPPKPNNYDSFNFKGVPYGGMIRNIPNRKYAWNCGRLIGLQHAYPEASWKERLEIEKQYRDFMLGQLWYLRNEAELPEKDREFWKSVGLAKDEFVDNGHFPHEIYVRESRRLAGLQTFTEHDGVRTGNLGRTPLHADSIAITDWPIDSVAVHDEKLPGTSAEGVYLMSEQSRPAQVPYGCLVSRSRTNLLAPVCLSATHVGWGAIRLEPVWVQCGEAAGLAAASAIKTDRKLSEITPAELQETLLAGGSMLAFLNDVADLPREEHAAMQWAALRGFFPTYDAEPDKPLDVETARLWRENKEPAKRAEALYALTNKGEPISASDFRALFGLQGESTDKTITRLEACMELYRTRNQRP